MSADDAKQEERMIPKRILVGHDGSKGADEAFARETAAEIRKKSPTSLKVAFVQMRLGKSLDLAAALKLEYRLASHLIVRQDYREGIAARIAGKGREPNWQPSTLAAVGDAEIEMWFTEPVEDELELDLRAPGPGAPILESP